MTRQPREATPRSSASTWRKWKAAHDEPEVRATSSTRTRPWPSSSAPRGTPAFFINGRKLSGAQPIENFKKRHRRGDAQGRGAGEAAAPSPRDVYAKVHGEAASTRPAAAPAQPPRPRRRPTVKKVDVPADSPVKGPKTAKVTIVEFSDFQCPFCSRVVPDDEADQGDVRQGRARGVPQPAAAVPPERAARRRGRAWPRTSRASSGRCTTSSSPTSRRSTARSLEKYAQELGLDMGKFKAALDSDKFDARRSRRTRPPATRWAPTARRPSSSTAASSSGAQPFEAFKAVIDEEIAKADKLLAVGHEAGPAL